MRNWADIIKYVTAFTQFGLSFITPLLLCLGVCWWLSVYAGVEDGFSSRDFFSGLAAHLW